MKSIELLDEFLANNNHPNSAHNFLVYEELYDVAEALELVQLLHANNILYHTQRPTKLVGDTVIVGEKMPQPIVILEALSADFEKIDALREAKLWELSENQVPKTHYLHDFSDDELLKILNESEKWHFQDWAFAKRLLENRGVKTTDVNLQQWRKEHAEIFHNPKTIKPLLRWGLAFMCIAFALTGSKLALAFALPFPFFVWYHSQREVAGQSYPTYDDVSRQWGLIVFILSALAFFISLSLGATNSFEY